MNLWISNNDRVLKPSTPKIVFNGHDNLEILRFEVNGDIYVHGRLVENDKEVVKGLREFLSSHGRGL